ncbi:hypothetical protein SY88_05625 [Clostridiales bacterium PH28_bin88]|nr:hypothetical protein SY88_05625 [Clostridiales bacterium PH28_bin88]
MTVTGRIHSIETFGTVDGPGIRYVVFFQGCPLKCQYCHNRDTWDPRGGREVTVDELVNDIRQYEGFYRSSGGGVTASGGEPALQAAFVEELFRRCHREDLHTALDTSGCVGPQRIAGLLEVTDLVLLDIKHIDPAKHRELTGVSNEKTLALARRLSEMGISVWVRHVLIPGLTDDPRDLARLGEFLAGLNNLQKVEILPYHTLGAYKWEQLGLKYPLKGAEPPSPEAVAQARELLAGFDLPTA